VALFVLVTFTVYQSYANLFIITALSKTKLAAIDLANEQFEIMRNMSYSRVGVQAGIPNGDIPHVQTITRSGNVFIVTTTIRNIDDPFDGTLGGSPNDTSPADYKLAEIEIACSACKGFSPVFLVTRVAPKNLETASTNGALFVQVFDANGQPVSNANVHIENNKITPQIIIDDVTNNQGFLQIVDAPPGVNAYEITVSKNGYSTDKTYLIGGSGNPNPTKPHVTVAIQQVSPISLSIDKTSILSFSTLTNLCVSVPSQSFSFIGSKLIGTPAVYKYDKNLSTDSGGQKILQDMEWDSYKLVLTSNDYELIGTDPLLPITILPNTNQSMRLILKPKNPNTLLIVVKDSGTQLPITDANVTLSETGFNQSALTGQGFLGQTDWSGGEGQATSTDTTKYLSSSDVSINSPVGELKLGQVLGTYFSSGYLISSTFDTGSIANFQEISWSPTSQPLQTGSNPIKFQFATNNDTSTWNFVGPDGTSGSYYTLDNRNLSALNAGKRYARYKVFLNTANTAFTPNLSEVFFTFTSGCIPPGQVFFDGLSSGTYTLNVSKTGYSTITQDISVSSAWQSVDISLLPQ